MNQGLAKELETLREKYWGSRTMMNCIALLHTSHPSQKPEIFHMDLYIESRQEANQAVLNYGLACINDHTLGEKIYYRQQSDRQFERANELLRRAYGR